MLYTLGLTIAAIALSIYAFWKWFCRNYDYFNKIDIPYKELEKWIPEYSISELAAEVYNAFPNER